MAISAKLMQVLKDMGQADLNILVAELPLAIEDEADILFPNAKVWLDAAEVELNPIIIPALQAVAAKVVF